MKKKKWKEEKMMKKKKMRKDRWREGRMDGGKEGIKGEEGEKKARRKRT